MVTRGSVNVCASPERSSLDYMWSPDMPLQSFTSTRTTCSASQLPITFEPVDSVSNLILSTPTPGCSCSLASFVSAIGLSRVPTRGVQTCWKWVPLCASPRHRDGQRRRHSHGLHGRSEGAMQPRPLPLFPPPSAPPSPYQGRTVSGQPGRHFTEPPRSSALG